jgi:hypothetical protein
MTGFVGVWLILIGGAVSLAAGCFVAASILAWSGSRLYKRIIVNRELRDFRDALRYWEASGKPRVRDLRDCLDKQADTDDLHSQRDTSEGQQQ